MRRISVFLVNANGPIVIYFGQYQSTLRTALINYLKQVDVTLILFSVEQHLWQWLDLNPSLTVASLVLQSVNNVPRIIARTRDYDGIRSVQVRCASSELSTLQRFCRSYARVDGLFDDDARLLVNLFVDLALFSEELGNDKREDVSSELEVQKHYARALKLCSLTTQIENTR